MSKEQNSNLTDYLVWLAEHPDQNPFPLQIANNETQTISVGNISDGYHTFDELYEMRMLLNAHLFNEWHTAGKYTVFKSIYHFDNNEVVPCFGGGWFMVVAKFPLSNKQISFHYETKYKYWELFKIPALDKRGIAKHYEFDGHASKDVAAILTELLK